MRALKISVIVAGMLWATAYRLGRTWGSTPSERSRRLPGDEVVLWPQLGGDHAITIARPPAEVWPWLVQMGWHRGGWYTYRWVDALFFPANAPSAETIVPTFQRLKVGDVVPDGPPGSGCFFGVIEIQPPHHLVLHSTTHLPVSLRSRPGVALTWTWTFMLEPVGVEATRFYFRWRGALTPRLLRLALGALITPADFLMGRSMCKGLKRRVEAQPTSLHDRPDDALRSPA